ncbi:MULTISPECIES: hypothetical protein [Bacillus]|uniref:hypothetical protein n=1 Tax=Bacillus TaxID=1386 RepID=UPI000917EA48|nr:MULTISPECIES: hypothetical protein [Bacillus]MED3269388.1 hypothetical protein [Bacillus thuringiensis]PFB43776.1 hypothetical protein CN396_20075 [Bacillus thuringiensis]PFE84313.1 hypothetical protein CN321_29695 [Bacillus thuringiensis]PFV40896.1 hypothetical protein COL03_19410 [Bacillus thuringiensis]PFV42726.1 hypothetical protein COL14_29365 [Bacillus thuringiensis]
MKVKSKEITNEFIKYFLDLDYKLLHEKKIVRNNEETYFNMSAISANISLFNNLSNEKDSQDYVTKQAVFFGNKLDGVGNTPLANPTEVSLSIFNLASESPRYTLNHIFGFLEGLGLSKENLLFRIANEEEIRRSFILEGIQESQLFVWRNMEEFNIGSNRPKGFYTYPYYKYKNGCVPLGSISFIKHNGVWTSDIAIFQERLSLILNQLDKIVLIDSIFPLYNYVSTELNLKDTLIMKITLLLRSIAFLVKDGLVEVSASYHGHFLKKLMREVAASLNSINFSDANKNNIFKFLEASLNEQGYSIRDKDREFSDILDKINIYSVDIYKSILKQNSRFLKNGIVDIQNISQTYGIKPDWILASSMVDNMFKNEARKFVKSRNSIRNKALSLDSSINVDLKELLTEN